MRLIPTALATASAFWQLAQAANSFAASNLYYAAGLTAAEQTKLFTGLKEANIKVLRVWLDGESSGQKGTTFTSYGALEASKAGSWDDTVLTNLDDVMNTAHSYGIKLLISMHSYNALSGKSDYYGKTYSTTSFYTSSTAMSQFKNRINHVLDHVNPHNNKRWGDSSEYIFAFEAQNEPMHDQEDPSALTAWQCTMAEAIKNGLNGTKILSTDGGGAYLDNSLLSAYFTCDALDVLSIHAYGTGDFATSKLQPYVSKAKSAGKKLIMEEWGACYYSSTNNRCSQASALSSSTRDSNIKTWAGNFDSVGLPWFYWQILPNEDPHSDWDYEIGINGSNWGALKTAAQAASKANAAFDFSDYLL